jgi:hypothetical protein
MAAVLRLLRPVLSLGVLVAVLLAGGAGSSPGATSASSLGLPIRAAFYYPWYPEAWTQHGLFPYTKYRPSAGFYNSADARTIARHLAEMRYAHIQAGIVSWWGIGHVTDTRFAQILRTTDARRSGIRWAVYYEREAATNPSVQDLNGDLRYIADHYASDPAYLRVGGRFVVFVYAGAHDDCGMVDRWKAANTVNAYVVLKVFSGYRKCSNQPDGWHQYAPAKSFDHQGAYSVSISPGFFKAGEAAPRLHRSLPAWRRAIRQLVGSHVAFKLITTFNEWGEGTAVEPARQWATRSGFGAYLDALHTNGRAVGRGHHAAHPKKKKKKKKKPRPPAPSGPTLLAAGDIADCGTPGDAATAAILAHTPGTIATLGDNAYNSGRPSEFANCYGPTWGRFLSRTKPSPGNHDYGTPNAAGYFGYFGAAAGPPGRGYYSYDLGTWHLISLNSNCDVTNDCAAGSAQEQWLKADLAAHRNRCTLAYWHHPLFSSGDHGNNTFMLPIWQDLYQAGADVVLNGHDHDYERFAPQNPDGGADPMRGIREFVVGTGGRDHRVFRKIKPQSEVRNDDTFGILRLTLGVGRYSWRFLPEAGRTFTDTGSGVCH